MILPAPRRRPLGLALVAYGIAGIVLIVAAGILVGGAIEQLASVSSQVGGQRDALVATLRATSVALDNASTGMGDVGTSLSAAQESSDRAAGLARSLRDTLEGLARAMDVSIFGTQPLAGLATGFGEAARQSGELATSLDEVAGALDRNSGGLDTTERDLVALRDRVDRLVQSLEATPLDLAPSPLLAQLALLGLLLWLGVPAVASVVIGLGLLRPGGLTGPRGGLG
jgi:ABC-type transporter Mla subunit MlaD